MGIYIHGVTFPTKFDYPLEIYINRYGDVEAYSADGKELGKAIEVKEHGRLIDTDELEPDENWSDKEDGFISFSQFAINNDKTIIPEDRG